MYICRGGDEIPQPHVHERLAHMNFPQATKIAHGHGLNVPLKVAYLRPRDNVQIKLLLELYDVEVACSLEIVTLAIMINSTPGHHHF